MPYKIKNQQKIAQHNEYLKNKANYVERRIKRRQKNKQFVFSMKTRCLNCGCTDKICLDFHHLKDKNKTISQMIRDSNVDKIAKEIEKCVVMCANCHRKTHAPSQIVTGLDWKNFNKARLIKREWYVNWLLNKKCLICGESDTRCLEFHHKGNKKFNISYLITSGHSLEFLKKEIEKCDLLCANCHRKIHGGYGVVDLHV